MFECYHRIISAVLFYNDTKKSPPFLAGDLEHFIIRHNILMNDLAFIIRQFYHSNVRSMPNPKGAGCPENKEQSFELICKFFMKINISYHPEFSETLKAFVNLTSKEMRVKRNRVIHYKAKAIIFQMEDLTFAFDDPCNTMSTIPTEAGGKKVVNESVFEFVNNTMVETLNFVNNKLVSVYKEYAKKQKWKHGEVNSKTKTVGTGLKISCIGIQLYKQTNGLV